MKYQFQQLSTEVGSVGEPLVKANTFLHKLEFFS